MWLLYKYWSSLVLLSFPFIYDLRFTLINDEFWKDERNEIQFYIGWSFLCLLLIKTEFSKIGWKFWEILGVVRMFYNGLWHWYGHPWNNFFEAKFWQFSLSKSNNLWNFFKNSLFVGSPFDHHWSLESVKFFLNLHEFLTQFLLKKL